MDENCFVFGFFFFGIIFFILDSLLDVKEMGVKIVFFISVFNKDS